MNTRNVIAVIMGLCLTVSASATPLFVRGAPNLEPSREGKPYPPIMVPVGGDRLLSLDCPVTASVEKPVRGEWSLLTDGDKDNEQEDRSTLVKYAPGIQWVQVDLRTSQVINAVCIWRFHENPCVYRDVVVQVSNDVSFKDGVTTVFNNDHDNSAGLGVGLDKEYFELNEGRPIPVAGIRARYVRVYSNGRYTWGEFDPFNYCTEIEVHGGESESEEKVQIKFKRPRPIFQ